MVYQENEEVYLTLSRKELQGLCKEHGLPVNHCKNELARLLVVYFTERAAERQASHGFSSKSVRSEHDMEGNMKVSRGACKRTASVDASKTHGFALKESASEKGGYSQIVDEAGNSCQMGGHTFVKGPDATAVESTYMTTEQIVGGRNQKTKVRQMDFVCSHSGLGDAGQNLVNTGNDKISTRSIKCTKFQDKISGECSNESGLASSSEIPSEASTSFQFFAMSEEGINLCVDLKSGPSDWINRLKNEVSICQEARLHKSQTISNQIKDVEIVDKTPKPSGRVGELYENVDFNSKSRSHTLTPSCLPNGTKEHIDGDQFISSSCMTYSRMQNTTASGSLSCATDMEASLQNPAETSVVNKMTTLVANSSQENFFSNPDINSGMDTRIPEHFNMKIDNGHCLFVHVTSIDDSFNSINNKSGSVRKSQDSSKPSEIDGSRACPTSLIKGSVDKCVLQSDAGESTEHICEEHTCSNLGNSAIRNPSLTINEKWGRSLLMKDNTNSGCSQVNKFEKTSKRTCNSDIPGEVQSKKQLVDTKVHIEPFMNSDSRDSLTWSRESVSDHTFLCRRSIRLVSK